MDSKELKKNQKQVKAKRLKDTYVSLADVKKRNNRQIPHEMVRNIVQTSKPDMPWITRHAIERAFTNFERDRQFNAVNPSDVTTNAYEEVADAMANLLLIPEPSPEPSSKSSPEPSMNESSRKKENVQSVPLTKKAVSLHSCYCIRQ